MFDDFIETFLAVSTVILHRREGSTLGSARDSMLAILVVSCDIVCRKHRKLVYFRQICAGRGSSDLRAYQE